MQTDELRAELAELAREVDPFPAEPAPIRRRVARRRIAGGSVALVLIVGLVAGVVATTRSGGDHIRVAGHAKQVKITELPRVDALVALPARATAVDIAGVKGILDSTVAVEQYATIPRKSGNFLLLGKTFGYSVILGVELDRSVKNGMHQLTAAVGYPATVKAFAPPGRSAGDDVEIFMTVNACQGQIDAVRTAIERDPDVESYRFFSKADALREFRKLFHDEPTLIQNTTAESLPVSFQLRVRDGASPTAVAHRYERLAGVRPTIVRANPFADGAPVNEPNTDRSACTPTP